MGMKTILSANRIFFMAFGEAKQEITKRVFRGEITDDVPASHLQRHRKTTICIDFDIT